MAITDDAHISSEEIERAIYLDFEGFQETPPAMAGILCADHFEQVVFDDALQSAAIEANCRVEYLDDEMRRLLTKCHDEKRRLVAFSQFEKDGCQLYADVDLGEVYCDGRKVAKRWINRACARNRLEGWELKEFLLLIEYPRPRNLGSRQTTQRLHHVRDMLQRRGEYQRLTSVAKAKWTRLLKHNRIDCFGLRELMRRTCSPFEEQPHTLFKNG